MKKFGILWVLFVLILSAPACSNSTRHVAVVVDTGLYEVLADTHAIEQQALCGLPSCATSSKVEALPGWTKAKSQQFNKDLLPAVEAGRQFNRLLATWKPGDPLPRQVVDTVNGLASALTAITTDFPDGSTKTQILGDIAKAQSIIINAFSVYLTLKGA